jgi:glycosyltransferase 2 family protein
MNNRGQRLFFLGKLALGVSLLVALLVWNDNGRKVLEGLAKTQPFYLIPFFCITYPLLGASCMKWALFLKEHRVVIGFHRLFGLYMVGYFFNNFLPSMVGGDVVRAYVLGKQIESHIHSLASVFLERFTGMIALVLLATTSFLFNAGLRQEPVVVASILIMGSACLALVATIWKPEWALLFLKPIAKNRHVARLVPKLMQFHDHVSYFKDKPALVGKAMLYSFTFQFLAAVNVYVACLVLAVPLSLYDAVVITPIILLVSSVPLTVNGLGVWEWACSVYLAQAGLPMDQGLAVALLLRAKNLLISLIGGILFLFDRAPAKVESERREQSA